MTEHIPTMLYIGDQCVGQRVLHDAALQGWQALVPTNVYDALTAYNTYLPDVIVIDMAADPVYVGETYAHLRHLHDQPLVLLVDAVAWYDRCDNGVFLLPPETDTHDLLTAIGQILRTTLEPLPCR